MMFLNFSAWGIEKTIRDLKALEKGLDAKVHEFLRRLADEGLKVASTKFTSALYAGTNDVEVTIEWQDNLNLALIAHGEAVAFIEFGTGTIAAPYPKTVEGIDKRGTFGKGKGKHPPWTYYGDPGNLGIEHTKKDGKIAVQTWGNPPARAMFDAGEWMKSKVKVIAKEVFR